MGKREESRGQTDPNLGTLLKMDESKTGEAPKSFWRQKWGNIILKNIFLNTGLENREDIEKKLNKMIQGMLATSSIGSTSIGSSKKQKNSKNNLFLLHWLH